MLAVYDAARRAVDRARAGGGPTLVEAHDLPHEGPRRARRAGVRARRRSSRSGAAATRSSATRARSSESGVATARGARRDRPRRSPSEVDREVELAEQSPLPAPEVALQNVYAPASAEAEPADRAEALVSGAPHLGGRPARPAVKGQTTYVDAIREGIREEMERDERVFLLGEDIGVYGGAFKVTDGLLARVRRGARHRHAASPRRRSSAPRSAPR